MDLFEAISRRHSYRGRFDPRAVPRDDLRRMVQAGLQAPSGYNAQSTSFVIVDDPTLLAELSEIVPGDVVRGARAAIVCIMDPGATRDKEFCFGIEDYAAAVENVLLAATALGYASVWIDGVLRRDGRAGRIGRLLGVPDELEVRVLLPVGAPAEERPQREKKPFGERAWFNRYRAL
jgi:nitroreductase